MASVVWVDGRAAGVENAGGATGLGDTMLDSEDVAGVAAVDAAVGVGAAERVAAAPLPRLRPADFGADKQHIHTRAKVGVRRQQQEAPSPKNGK